MLADVVQGADVRVRQLRDRAGLAVEALAELRIGGEAVGENLDCDGAIEPRITGFVHLAYPAGPDGDENLVRAAACASRQGHGATLIPVAEPLTTKEKRATHSTPAS